MGFYQVMIMIPETSWRAYAIASVHGGIIGGIFVLVPITLIASVIGEFYILEENLSKSEKNKKYALLGLINLAIGFCLWLIPGGFPSKRQSTMGWATISLGLCVFISYIFILTDYKTKDYPKLNPVNKFRIALFNSYGMNPLLIYAIVEITSVVLEEAVFDGSIPYEMTIVLWISLTIGMALLGYILYKKGKAISTTKVAFGVIVIVLVLAVVLIPIL